jgi:uncharacterized phiE125 gp8 family phage protein
MAQRYALALVTPAGTDPVSLTEARTHLRVDSDDDTESTYITALISAATQWAQMFLNRQLVTATYDLYLQGWPDGDHIDMPLPPLQSVASVKYTDSAGVEHTMPATDYHVDAASFVGRIVLAYGESWPSETLRTSNPIVVRFTCGYGAASAVPTSIKHAILLVTGTLYAKRETIEISHIVQEVPFAAEALLRPYRVIPV